MEPKGFRRLHPKTSVERDRFPVKDVSAVVSPLDHLARSGHDVTGAQESLAELEGQPVGRAVDSN